MEFWPVGMFVDVGRHNLRTSCGDYGSYSPQRQGYSPQILRRILALNDSVGQFDSTAVTRTGSSLDTSTPRTRLTFARGRRTAAAAAELASASISSGLDCQTALHDSFDPQRLF